MKMQEVYHGGVEVFDHTSDYFTSDSAPGLYYWHCLPGRLPTSAPQGPFASIRDLLEAADALSTPRGE